MRGAVALLVVVLAGCPHGDTCSDAGGSCSGGLVCTRDGECLSAAEVRAVKVTWTIGGMPASANACANNPDFLLQFLDPSSNGSFGYEPVPCMEGQFTIDKIPVRFTYVEIESAVAAIDPSTNAASLALPP
jgi:hypothetical protein